MKVSFGTVPRPNPVGQGRSEMSHRHISYTSSELVVSKNANKNLWDKLGMKKSVRRFDKLKMHNSTFAKCTLDIPLSW